MSATPQGRDAVRRALVRAATRLYARHGPRAVSVRDVAATAGVNHGLVHRHFGSKDGLTSEVMRSLVAKLESDLGPDDAGEALAPAIARILHTTRRHRALWQILARALLDGADPRRLQDSFPVVERLRRRLAEAPRRPAGLDARTVTAIAVAAGLGLVAFGPFIRAAVGMDAAQWETFLEGLPQGFASVLGSIPS